MTISLISASLIFIIASSSISDVEGCECQLDTPAFAYCNADWVAHARINNRQDNQRMPPGIIDRQINSNTRYEVKWIEPFKISEEINGTLSRDVYTGTEDAACGILLEPAQEYLLSGRFVNGTLLTGLCWQVLLEDREKAREHDILLWSEAPEKLKDQMKSKEFDKQCKDLLFI